MAQSPHTWHFFRAGGFDQVRLDSGADLLALDQLDQKLWTALACPTTGLEFDKQTLALIDTDKDGRVRARRRKKIQRIEPIIDPETGEIDPDALSRQVGLAQRIVVEQPDNAINALRQLLNEPAPEGME